MNRFHSKKFWLCLIAHLSIPFSFVTHAKAGDYYECVGRYELILPGPVDVATTTPTLFDGKFIKYPIQFPDGQSTMYSSFGFNGEFQIFQVASKAWAHEFLIKRRLFIAASKKESNEDKRLFEIPTDQPDTLVMYGPLFSAFYIFRDEKLIRFIISTYREGVETIKKRAVDTLTSLRMRKPYEIPRTPGACLPGIFIADSGEDEGRTVGVTFRLKDHPDVTVFLLDSSAGDLSKMTSRQRNEFVWTSDAVGRVIHLHGPLRYRPTIMAGRLGTASFATVTRYDGATDYAYLVTVQGDPNASVDTPDLELLVERTAKYAKGVPPVSGDQLEDIAKAIAASVTRRPVQ